MSQKGLIASKGFDLAISQQLLAEPSDLGKALRGWGSLILETVSSHQTCFSYSAYFQAGLHEVSNLCSSSWWDGSYQLLKGSHFPAGDRTAGHLLPLTPAESGGALLSFTSVLCRTPNSEITEIQIASLDHSQLSFRDKTSRKSPSQCMRILTFLSIAWTKTQ